MWVLRGDCWGFWGFWGDFDYGFLVALMMGFLQGWVWRGVGIIWLCSRFAAGLGGFSVRCRWVWAICRFWVGWYSRLGFDGVSLLWVVGLVLGFGFGGWCCLMVTFGELADFCFSAAWVSSFR